MERVSSNEISRSGRATVHVSLDHEDVTAAVSSVPPAGAHQAQNGGSVTGATDGDGHGGGPLGWALWPLWATVDAVKWVGGAVRDTTIAPAMRLASPWGLVESVRTTAKTFSPQRVRDVARLVGNGGRDAVGLLATNECSAVVRAGGRVLGSLKGSVSSPAGRQLLLDSATGWAKLVEALATPEAQGAIQQGAVVLARGADVLASRQAKSLYKDVADVVVGLVELANSPAATNMVAEFTANITHALEMEHLAGLQRGSAVSPNTSTSTGEESGSIAEEAAPSSGRAPAEASSDDNPHQADNAGEGTASDDNPHQADNAEEGTASDDNPRQADNAGEGTAPDSDGVGDGGCSERIRVLTAELRRRGVRVDLPRIGEADNTGDIPLHIVLPAVGTGRPGAVVAGAAPGDALPEAGRSAPSSPTGRHESWGAANSLNGGSRLEDGGVDRRRANNDTPVGDVGGGVGDGIGGGGGGGRDEAGREQASRGVATRIPAYVRDGRAILPRFSGATFAAVLRGPQVGLDAQLEAPTEQSLGDTLARAARRSTLGSLTPRSRRARRGADGAIAPSPKTTKTGGWKQAVFGMVILFLAGDGLQHRCNRVFGLAPRVVSRPMVGCVGNDCVGDT